MEALREAIRKLATKKSAPGFDKTEAEVAVFIIAELAT